MKNLAVIPLLFLLAACNREVEIDPAPAYEPIVPPECGLGRADDYVPDVVPNRMEDFGYQRPVVNVLHDGRVVVLGETLFDPGDAAADLQPVHKQLVLMANWMRQEQVDGHGPLLPAEPLLVRADERAPTGVVTDILAALVLMGIQIHKVDFDVRSPGEPAEENAAPSSLVRMELARGDVTVRPAVEGPAPVRIHVDHTTGELAFTLDGAPHASLDSLGAALDAGGNASTRPVHISGGEALPFGELWPVFSLARKRGFQHVIFVKP